jgi:hypothetical protein
MSVLVPVDNIAAVEALDPVSRELAVTQMLSEARSWLAHAVEASEPQSIANFKAQMATVAEATKQLGLSKGIQMDAQEMVRRAERGVGLAIRKGQAEGTIRSRGDDTRTDLSGHNTLVSPTAFVPHDELVGNGAGIYHLTDGVTDEQFDGALTQAKAEENLSRANVVRKIRRKTQDNPEPQSRRKPLPASFREASLDLGKVTSRIQKLAGDDRFPKNKGEVARYANDLIRARDTLQRVIDQLS